MVQPGKNYEDGYFKKPKVKEIPEGEPLDTQESGVINKPEIMKPIIDDAPARIISALEGLLHNGKAPEKISKTLKNFLENKGVYSVDSLTSMEAYQKAGQIIYGEDFQLKPREENAENSISQSSKDEASLKDKERIGEDERIRFLNALNKELNSMIDSGMISPEQATEKRAVALVIDNGFSKNPEEDALSFARAGVIERKENKDKFQEYKEYLENILADYNNGKKVTRNSKFAEVLERAGIDTKKLTAKQFIEKARIIIENNKPANSQEGISDQEFSTPSKINSDNGQTLQGENQTLTKEQIVEKIVTLREETQEKKLSPLEKFDNKIEKIKEEGDFSSDLLYEKVKKLYLEELGWKVKYDFWHNKAWLVNKEGAFINEQGETIKTKKEKRAEFKTKWRFPNADTPIIKFMRAQLEKKFEGSIQG